jgi:hypothetical protein
MQLKIACHTTHNFRYGIPLPSVGKYAMELEKPYEILQNSVEFVHIKLSPMETKMFAVGMKIAHFVTYVI